MSRLRSHRALAITATLAAVGIVAAGCASSNHPDASGDGSGGGTLRIALAAPPTSLDPANMEQSTSPFAQPAYDALIRVDEDGTLSPGLATEWGFTDDENRVFELTVRDGVTFSDGAELDADAVVANLEHLDEGNSNVAGLVNGGTYTAVDDMTVRIEWDAPHPLAAQALTQTWVSGMMASPDVLADDPDSLATQTAGAGPYELDAANTTAGSTYTYTARDDYGDPDRQSWDEIVITVMDNPDQRLNALRTGEIDYMVGDLSTADSAEADGVQVLYAPTIVYGLSLLDRDGALDSPLQDLRVRQAINHALDREGIAEALLGDYGFATEQTIVPSEPGYLEDHEGYWSYDPDLARELLTEAGYPDGFTLPVIASTTATAAQFAQIYAGQLEEVGITLELDTRPGPDYFEAMTSGTFPAAGIGYGSQPMPMEYDGLFGPDASFNPLGVTSQTVQDTLAEATSMPQDEAVSLYEDINREIIEDAWYAPVAFAPVFYYAADTIAPTAVTDARPQVPLTELQPAA
ncbi:ABC transporter substrate-binding protein [Microbacterium indicum]|uniref:ABC transporter substrate-binding protein n=1 Tax=Microbacterium indicum TaxID=358100 RepID=UPI00048F2C9C|nr:ABC transporter substrate-binding protein [Microbacterium indicum]